MFISLGSDLNLFFSSNVSLFADFPTAVSLSLSLSLSHCLSLPLSLSLSISLSLSLSPSLSLPLYLSLIVSLSLSLSLSLTISHTLPFLSFFLLLFAFDLENMLNQLHEYDICRMYRCDCLRQRLNFNGNEKNDLKIC